MKYKNARRSEIAVITIAFTWLLAAHIVAAAPDASAVPSLIVGPVDANETASLVGNTYPLATPAADQGLVSGDQQLGQMFVALKRSSPQERALTEFNARQLDRGSPDYHHWLQPQEFGLKYGPNDADIAAVTGWLKAAGLQIHNVSAGRIAIEFSGTAAQIQEAFGVEMHRYLVNGATLIANDRNPQIPRALTPVIAGIVGLNTAPVQSATPRGSAVPTAAAQNGAFAPSPTPTTVGLGARPALSYQDGPYPYAFVTPYDFATIYNSLPLWGAGKPVTGSGVTIAVVGDNDVKIDDVTAYQSTFGLRVSAPTVEFVGANPGGSSKQSTVELEMASAAAPGTSLKLVVPAGGLTVASVLSAVDYTVDHNLAPIIVFPYFACERLLGSANNALINGYWQQGASQGMSIFVAAGDLGSASCNNSGGPDSTGGPQGGLEVNGFASSPYVTAVGGTDFAWQWGTDKFSTYWKAPSNPVQYESAKGYIPEVPWNASCTNSLLLQGGQGYLIEDTNDGHLPDYTSSQNLCSANYNNSYYSPLLHSIAGGGGASNCSAVGSTGLCTAAYAKPEWQKGTGVPSDGKRDLPDVSLFASGGWLDVQQYGVEFDPPTPIIPSTEMLICYSGGSPSHACTYDTYAGAAHQTYGGTGAAAGYWAGILALVEQKQGGERQGLINPTLYSLFRGESLSSCNSNSVTAGNTCVFYDVSTAVTNGVACVPGSSEDCFVIPGSTGEYETTFGILDGYTAGVGYDQATGLGSVNITNLVNRWPSNSGSALTLSVTSLAFGEQAAGSTSASKSVTLTNNGSASLTLSSIVLTGGQADDFALSKTCGGSLAAGASCSLSVAFKPVSTGTKVASVTITDNASGSPQTIALSGTGASDGSGAALTLSVTSLAFGDESVGSSSAAKSVTLKNGGSASLTLSSIALTGGQADDFALSKTCGGSLAAGASCNLSVAFKPVSTGTKVASVTITDNASGSPQTIALSGTGASDGSGAALTLSVTSLAFGDESVGSSSAAKSVTLKNGGSASLTLSSIAVTGGQADDFVLSKTCGGSLSAGASCTLSVLFKPVSSGAKIASVSITDNASGSPQSIALTGTGN